ncbi:MAG: porin [Desulfobacteraceae bacterium]|jgi:hypothetical protein
MKKLLVVLMVLALAAPAAMADDTLDLSGAMRARAFDKTNHNFDTDTDTDHRQYWDQRFRVQGTITPSEGVQGVFRLDMAENVWGSDDMDDLDSNQDPGGVDVDRAYLVATKGPVTVVAGLQYLGLGNAVAYDAVHTGLAFVIKTPLVITAGWAKVDEDQTDVGDTTDEEGFEDIDHYFINLGYSAKAFSVNGFYAFQTDGADGTAANPNVEANAIGVQGKFAVGPVNFNVELNIFGGEIDDGTSTVDLVGTQLFGDVNMAMSDALTLGLNFVYSMGTDEDNEVKLTCLTDDGSTVFADYGSMNTLGISPLGRNDIFDDGNGTGTLGGILYTKFQVIPDLTLFGSVGYVTAETELDMTGELDSLMLVNLSAKYTLVPNAHISLHYGYFDLTAADDVDTDNATTLGARLQIDF